MTDYQKPYHLLFNAITDALEALERLLSLIHISEPTRPY